MYFLKSFRSFLSLFIAFILFIAGYLFYFKQSGALSASKSMQKVGWWSRPSFHDDLETVSLIAAIEKNDEYLKRLTPDTTFNYGGKKYSVAEVMESSKHFVSILKEVRDEADLNRRIIEDFDILQSAGSDRRKRVLFTGYYEPILTGSKEKTERYRYPIYSKPDNLIEINLGYFRRSLSGKRIAARIDNNTVLPYYDRRSIDKLGLLEGHGLEIAWLADPVDAFFLHIQGSGIIEMEDGTSVNVNYAAANGKDYRSIGRLLIEEGKVAKKDMSMKAIQEYLTAHPEEMERILYYNESYVFFRIVKEGPIGSTGVKLTPGRSIASDAALFPKGGIAYIETESPVTDMNGNVTGWKKISRFAADQDTGGAIKGPGRIDIFFGTGSEAERLAGAMNRYGKLFYLIKKRRP